MKKRCENCKCTYSAYRQKQKYCSTSCKYKMVGVAISLSKKQVPIDKKCLVCEKLFSVSKYRKDTAMFCSCNCAAKHKWINPTKLLLCRKDTTPRGEDSPHWVGDKITYGGLHSYIKYKYEKEGVCEHCGEEKKTCWANRTGKYLRDRDDWIELCYRCHLHYDRQNPVQHKYTDVTRHKKIVYEVGL